MFEGQFTKIQYSHYSGHSITSKVMLNFQTYCHCDPVQHEIHEYTGAGGSGIVRRGCSLAVTSLRSWNILCYYHISCYSNSVGSGINVENSKPYTLMMEGWGWVL